MINDLQAKVDRLNITDDFDESTIPFLEEDDDESEDGVDDEERINYYIDYGQPNEEMNAEEINQVQEQVDSKGRKWESQA